MTVGKSCSRFGYGRISGTECHAELRGVEDGVAGEGEFAALGGEGELNRTIMARPAGAPNGTFGAASTSNTHLTLGIPNRYAWTRHPLGSTESITLRDNHYGSDVCRRRRLADGVPPVVASPRGAPADQRAVHDWLNPAASRAAMDGSLAADFFSTSISR